MNILVLKKTPDPLTKSKTKFNGAWFDHVEWTIRENILTFEGYKIETLTAFWWNDAILKVGLDKIEDRFIKNFTEKYGFLYLKKRKFRGVTGEYVLKKRNYYKITTNIWTVIGENDHEQRSTNKK